MIKTSSALCVIALAAIALPAGAESKTADDASQFKGLINQYCAAWSSGNTDNPAKLFAKEANLVFYDLAPLKYTGWEEYKQGVQKTFFESMTSVTLTPKDDLLVTRRGNIAWTSVTGHVSAKMKDGKGMELDYRHTAVWEKRGGKWLIVHDHISTPLP